MIRLLLSLWLIGLCTLPAYATVIEFKKDGRVVKHESLDYLTKHRKQRGQGPQNAESLYALYIAAASARHGVNETLLHAVIKAESNYQAHAVSKAGAEGLMQLMPATAKRFGVRNSFDPAQNIEGGTAYLSFLLKRYQGNIRLALAAYNAGEKAVDRYKTIPPYPETIAYVKTIMRYLRKNKQLVSGT